MVKVNLKRPFFAPDGTQYFPHGNPHDFPNNWELPSTAEVEDPVKLSDFGVREDKEEERKLSPEEELAAKRVAFEKMTVPELQKLLRDKKIDFESDANKASLIDKLLA